MTIEEQFAQKDQIHTFFHQGWLLFEENGQLYILIGPKLGVLGTP